MNPILATGLVSLGQELIHKINSPKAPPAGIDFQAVLDGEKISSTESRPAAKLNSVRHALANSPEVHSLVSGDAQGFWLTELEDGSFAISTDSKGPVRINPGSPTESLAREFHTLGKNTGGSELSTGLDPKSIWINASH